ncbi:MAG: SpoIIE family protein phosphatase, partial [Bacteroidales bacterium]|nr:SpoIIE family protein phosphatase [Bacteroidales bacterium]
SAAMMMSSAVNLFRMTAQHYNTPEEIVRQTQKNIRKVLTKGFSCCIFATINKT